MYMFVDGLHVYLSGVDVHDDVDGVCVYLPVLDICT